MKSLGDGRTASAMIGVMAGVVLLWATLAVGHAIVVSRQISLIDEWGVAVFLAVGWLTLIGAGSGQHTRRSGALILGVGASFGALACMIIAVQFREVGKLAPEQFGQFVGLTVGLFGLIAAGAFGTAAFGRPAS